MQLESAYHMAAGIFLGNIFIDTVDDLRVCGIQFVSLTENIDTSTAMGRAFWQFIALMAEFERELIRERTREELMAAKRHGQKLGQPFALNDNQIIKAHGAVTDGTCVLGEIAQLTAYHA